MAKSSKKTTGRKAPRRQARKEIIPYSRKPEILSFDEWQIGLRRQFAQQQQFKSKNLGQHPVFSDFEVQSAGSPRAYKVAIRSNDPGLNFCGCPDFRVNSLGTCKHIEYLLHKFRKNAVARKALEKGYQPGYSSVTLKYGAERKIVLRIGTTRSAQMRKLAQSCFDRSGVLNIHGFSAFDNFLKKAYRLDPEFRCYHDALEFIIEKREYNNRKALLEEKFGKPEATGWKSLVNVSLYPYQREAVLTAAIAGRFILADEMGLGKTIQALAVAQLLRRVLKIERVLVVCPTSLKYQWKSEINRFTGDENALVVEGLRHERERQYGEEVFFSIASYNAVINDCDLVNRAGFDLVILDEAQRIKNWKTKTAQSIKKLAAQYRLVLTGTPLENKLDELHSLVEFVDPYALGLLARFLHKHQVTDEKGRVIGYQQLNEIGKALSPICLRRTKKDVLRQLPKRTDKNVLVQVTPEQKSIHDEHADKVARLVQKWQRFGFLKEADRQALMINLNCMRMVSDSTYILDQQTRFDTKIGELLNVLSTIRDSGNEKVVVFSQWERMTRLIARELDKMGIRYQYLHGGVPSKERKQLLETFRENADCRVFLSTDAGGVGLNLQSASWLINMDCPWNPAVLEQRIGRVYRLGQARPVNVINFISKGTIEERILDLLSFKQRLFDGVLDGGEDSVFMGESRMKKFMATVEQLTSGVAPVTGKTEPQLAEADIPEDTAAGPVGEVPGESPVGTPHMTGPGNDLLDSGLGFLAKVGEWLNTYKGDFSSLLAKDEQTGKTFFKIPVANEAAARQTLSAVGDLLKRLAGQ